MRGLPRSVAPVSVTIWDATTTTTSLCLFPATLPPAPALAAPCAGLRHCSELLSEANSCAHSCMPGSVSGCLGASVVLTALTAGQAPLGCLLGALPAPRPATPLCPRNDNTPVSASPRVN